MSYNSFSNSSIDTQSTDTQTSTTHMYRMEFSGLRPNTKHLMYLDGEDYSWACCQFGKNIGDDMVTNSHGNISVKVLYEIPFSRPADYEIEEPNSISFYSNRLSNINGRMEDIVNVQEKVFEIRSEDGISRAIFRMHFHIVLVNTDYNRIEQHD